MRKRKSASRPVGKVLVIEDEPTYSSLIRTALESSGYKVACARDGLSGQTAIIEHQPDAIILDILLPLCDGFSFLTELKSQETTRAIPVVILSNLDGSQEIARGLELGAAAYLIKYRAKLNEVVGKIDECLKKLE
ncbi:MAG: response regulator [Patescibacteria group bacterium]